MKIHRHLLCVSCLITTLTLGITATIWFRTLVKWTTDVAETMSAKIRDIAVAEILVQPKQEAKPIEAATIPTNRDQTQGEEALDYSGYYYLDSDERQKSFPDFQYIDLTTYEYSFGGNGEYDGRRIAPEGAVQGSSRYDFTRIAIINNEIMFQTKTVNGISYKFAGNFANDLPKNYCTYDQTLPALTGKLTKMKNGKWDAELDVDLGVTCGD